MNPPKKKEPKKKESNCKIGQKNRACLKVLHELESTKRRFEEIIGGIDSLDDVSMSRRDKRRKIQLKCLVAETEISVNTIQSTIPNLGHSGGLQYSLSRTKTMAKRREALRRVGKHIDDKSRYPLPKSTQCPPKSKLLVSSSPTKRTHTTRSTKVAPMKGKGKDIKSPKIPSMIQTAIDDRVSSKRFLSPIESVSLLSKIPAKKKRDDDISRKMLIDIFINEKLVPTKKTVIYKYLKLYNDHPNSVGNRIPECWDVRGRQPLLTELEISQLVDDINNKNINRTITLDDVESFLMEFRLKKNPEFTPQTLPSIHRTTVAHYFTLLSTHENLQTTSSVQQKTDARFAAENSWFSTICYLMTIATTHFRFSTLKVKGDIDCKMASDGAQMFADLIRKQNKGMDIRPILPGLTFNTDDQTCFVFKGTSTNKKKLYLEAVDVNNSVHSSYANDSGGTDHLNGARVRITHTFSSMGYMAPVYATVTGLNDRELPPNACKDGVLLVEVPGLVTSSNSTASNEIGYIAFLRPERNIATQKTSEELNFEYYRKKILVPFVIKLRELLYDFKSTTNVPADYTAVCWNDGANTQLAAVVNESQQKIDDDLKIISNKHSASRTAVEQACDMASCFRLINTHLKTHTTEHLPIHNLRDLLKEKFKLLKAEGKLNLKSNAQAAFIDFFSSYPTVLQKACPNDSVMKGFLRNGMIDRKSFSWPDMTEIIKSCQNNKVRQNEWNLLLEHFPALYEYAMRDGHIPDSYLKELGFSPDVDFDGNEVTRPSAITCESLHRAKSLSHAKLRKLRESRQTAIVDSERAKKQKEIDTIRGYLASNTQCESVLRDLLRANGRELSFSLLTHSDFAHRKVTLSLLKPFYIVRKSDVLLTLGNVNKGSVGQAIAGEDCMILRSYECRNQPIKMNLPSLSSPLPQNQDNVTDAAVTVIPSDYGSNEIKSASYFLSNEQWIGDAVKTVKGIRAIDVAQYTASDEEKRIANKMLCLLNHRLHEYVSRKWKDSDKLNKLTNNHLYCFIKRNLPCVVALFILTRHVKQKIHSDSSALCMLKHPSAIDGDYVLASGDVGKYQGVYLFFDAAAESWIRSGVVVGSSCTFSSKYNVYKEISTKVKRCDGMFHQMYPETASKDTNGSFNHLTYYCGIGYDRDNCSLMVEDGGLFDWNKDEVEYMKKRNCVGCTTAKDKKLFFVAHLLEFIYRLSIASGQEEEYFPKNTILEF